MLPLQCLVGEAEAKDGGQAQEGLGFLKVDAPVPSPIRSGGHGGKEATHQPLCTPIGQWPSTLQPPPGWSPGVPAAHFILPLVTPHCPLPFCPTCLLACLSLCPSGRAPLGGSTLASRLLRSPSLLSFSNVPPWLHQGQEGVQGSGILGLKAQRGQELTSGCTARPRALLLPPPRFLQPHLLQWQDIQAH